VAEIQAPVERLLTCQTLQAAIEITERLNAEPDSHAGVR
jgi:hypothetical protein